MELVRLVSLNFSEARKIRARQQKNTMTEHYDEDGYLCFDPKELQTYKPRKSGRKPKGMVK